MKCAWLANSPFEGQVPTTTKTTIALAITKWLCVMHYIRHYMDIQDFVGLF